MLTRASFRSIAPAHISLTLVGLMWVLPFLYYHHAYPLTTFYQEWGAVLISLCAMPVLMGKRYWQRAEVPRIVLLPIGMILLLLLQYFLGKMPSFDQTLLYCMYFLWIWLLLMLGNCLREELGLPALATTLAVFLVIGAELNALSGIIQHYRWHTFLNSVVTTQVSSAVYGNIAQPNHFANYITLGLVSLGLLFATGRIRIWMAVLMAGPLMFVLVLSGSRGTWLYLLFMLGISYLWQRRERQYLPILKYCIWLFAGFVLMNFIVQMPWLAGVSGNVTATHRMIADGGSGDIRLYLWKESLLIFTHYPFFGAGFGQFAWQHFELLPELQNTRIVGLYNNAHNLLMQLAAETGLAGLTIVFATLGASVWQAWRAPRSIYQWWGFCILAVLGIHSMLEYPLWYGYFLGIAAFTLGVMDSKTYRLELHGVGRVMIMMVLLLGTLLLLQLFQGYKQLEDAMMLRPDSSNYISKRNENLSNAYGYVLIRPYAELFMSGLTVANSEKLADKLALNERVMRFVPVASVVYRQVWLLSLADRLPDAKLQLQRALWSYPGEFRKAEQELRRLALKDPVHFSALLEFALQKKEEYQRAVLGK